MSAARYVRWQDGEMWLCYFKQFPGYLTQDESLAELEQNLRGLYRGLISGEIPGLRRVSELSEWGGPIRHKIYNPVAMRLLKMLGIN